MKYDDQQAKTIVKSQTARTLAAQSKPKSDLVLGQHEPEETKGKMPEKLVINDNYIMSQNVQPAPQIRPTRGHGPTGHAGHKRSNSTAVANPSSFSRRSSNLGGFDIIEGTEYQ